MQNFEVQMWRSMSKHNRFILLWQVSTWLCWRTRWIVHWSVHTTMRELQPEAECFLRWFSFVPHQMITKSIEREIFSLRSKRFRTPFRRLFPPIRGNFRSLAARILGQAEQIEGRGKRMEGRLHRGQTSEAVFFFLIRKIYSRCSRNVSEDILISGRV